LLELALGLLVLFAALLVALARALLTARHWNRLHDQLDELMRLMRPPWRR
jgi:hypothetical protein